jgi:uncharacterized membrane protein
MDKNDYLKIIMAFSIFGMLFSGYLSWGDLFPGVSSAFGCAAASTKILGVPTCIYGFIMYLIIGILSVMALKSKK